MSRLPRAAVARPWLTLGLVAVAVAGLFVAGRDLEARLTPTLLIVDGTESSRAADLYSAEFGDGISIPVMLEGPERALERQGPALVERLRDRPDLRVLSAWDAGRAGEALRPRRDRALIVVAVDQPYTEAVEEGLADVRREVGRVVEDPVRARVTGTAAIGSGVKESSLETVARAERMAIPILIVVLLLVFRSVVAAAIPAVVGGIAVLSGHGSLALLTRLVDVDAIAVSLASMMGLALGVDYSLLIVSRFREELWAGAERREAALTTIATAGRTVLFAAAVLAAAMLVALVTAPGDLLMSAALGVLVAVFASVAAALTGIPAALVLLGPTIDRGWLGRRSRRGRRGPVVAAAIALLRRPAVPALLVLALLLGLTAPAAALRTGPPDVRMLPEDSPVREDFEAVRDVMGAGWTAPFEVVVRVPDGAITERERLEAMQRWQRRVARMEGVDGVVGPGAIAQDMPEDPGAGLEQAAERLRQGRRQLAQLERGLGEARDGVGELRDGLLEAAEGAAALEGGGRQAAEGARRIRQGLARAASGAVRLGEGLRAAREGSRRLERGARESARGAARLARSLRRAQREVEQGARRAEALPRGLREGADDLGRLREPAQRVEGELRAALQALDRMVVGRADPQYVEAYRATATALAAATGREPITGARVDPDYEGLDASIAEAERGLREAARAADELVDGTRELADGLDELADGAGRLRRGARELEDGAEELATGLSRLADGSDELASGLAPLLHGAGRLDGGLQALSGGAGRLASGLGEGHRRSNELGRGLQEGEERVGRQRRELVQTDVQGLGRSARRSPGLFDSGYFTLAAIDGARERDRAAAEFAVSVGQGGQGARIMVIPETGPNEPETAAVRERLRPEARRLARAVGGDAVVGGPAAFLDDYDRITSARFPLLVAGIVLASYLVLVPIFRSLLLPALAVVLNLVTVGAAFGILALLYQGGGPLADAGFLDAVSTAGIFCVLFGLSIDYEVFLMTRMREGWERLGSTTEAIAYGLDRTAAVVTGAAAIMFGVFAAFAFTDVASIQQFGIGLAVAVLIDATVVRLILLPAAMRALGRGCWWLPGWLDRILPRVDVEGAQSSARAEAGASSASPAPSRSPRSD